MQPFFVPSAPGEPLPGDEPPKVLIYYRVYAGLMCALYVLTVLLGAVMIAVVPASTSSRHLPPWITGVVFVFVGAPLALAYAVGVFGGRARWGYTYGTALIAIGMTSMCCLPASIPLLIFWLKPEVKAWFNQ